MIIKATHRLEVAANSPFFEIARVLVRFDHIASRIVNANHASCERLRNFLGVR
jgi:hypothetical protein